MYTRILGFAAVAACLAMPVSAA
ncbi:polyisoprenoid-binding protein, partial [Mesorhizobium sp. M7A.F.Ca.CA.004.01.1.1]